MSRRLRILLVIRNLRGGGAEAAFLRYGDILSRAGHEVEMVLIDKVHDYALPTAFPVTWLRPRSPGRSLVGRLAAAWHLRRWYARATRRAPFDVILSTLGYADQAVRLARLPQPWHRIANTLTETTRKGGDAGTPAARRRAERLVRRYAGANLVAVSDGVASDLARLLGRRAGRIETLFNPFDFAQVRELARAAAPLPAAPYIIHVGRFSPQKRHDLLLDAYAASGIAHRLVLLTKLAAELDAMIAARGLGGRAIVAGFQENPYPWIAGASALVLASDHEGLPNVIVEAMICGTPVVATDCPSGPADLLVGEQAAFLVPCGDVAALGAAIARIVVAPPAADSAHLQRFSAESFLNGMARLAASGPRI